LISRIDLLVTAANASTRSQPSSGGLLDAETGANEGRSIKKPVPFAASGLADMTSEGVDSAGFRCERVLVVPCTRRGDQL
jgi:hypothetical protein